MKTKLNVWALAALTLLVSCNKDDKITGEQSPMGEVGNIVSSSSGTIAGVSAFSAEVISLNNGVSTYTGSATVTNEAIKSILSNAPECTVNGNQITASNIKFKSTLEGIEAVSGLDPGVIVKYDAKVGDKYSIGSSKKTREVVSRSTDDDYMYGFFLIKAIQVEEYPGKMGVDKITYWANHRFGLVGIQFNFDDGTIAKFPVYNSFEN
ncbi:MAG: hypothetical protein IH594_08370 [Bacteroidales bacterium]|nr:hypothetical protein [Bacteroidales bacterium]